MLRPAANQAKVATTSGIQAVVAGQSGKRVAVHSGILMIDGDDSIILCSGTVDSHTEDSGAMPFEAQGGFTMQPSVDPWYTTEVGEGLVLKSQGGSDIFGLIRWSYQ
jgi:hypothetical protein